METRRKLLRASTGQTLAVDFGASLGAGGEARVYAAEAGPGEAALVAKLYRQATERRIAKLRAMLANPPEDPMADQGHVSIAWPIDLLAVPQPDSGPRGTTRVVGFLMPRATGTRPVIDFYNPRTRRRECPLFSYLYLHRAARNIAAAVHAVHSRGYVIGDVNESNILVTDTALATLVDTDSFQVNDPASGTVYRCPVGKPEFTPPELQGAAFGDIDRAPEHDRFGLGVLIFQLLMEGTHPFAGVYNMSGGGDPPSYASRILAGHFPYGAREVPYQPMPIAPAFGTLAPGLQALVLRCFEEGHADPAARPDAEAWVAALHDAENALVPCRANPQHRYGDHLRACPWCERAARLGGRDPFPSREAVLIGDHRREPEPALSARTPEAARAPAPLSPPTRQSPVAAGPNPVSAPAAAPAVASAVLEAESPVAMVEPQLSRLGPTIHTVSHRRRAAPMRRTSAAWTRAAAIGGVVVLGVVAYLGATAQMRRADQKRALDSVRRLNGAAAAAHMRFQAPAAAAGDLKALSAQEENDARDAVSIARVHFGAHPADAEAAAAVAASSATQAVADADASALDAQALNSDVMAAIEKYKSASLTEQQAARIRDELKAKLDNALAKCDTALRDDPDNGVAWIERVRALHLAADDAGARAAVALALSRVPADPELLRLQRLVSGG